MQHPVKAFAAALAWTTTTVLVFSPPAVQAAIDLAFISEPNTAAAAMNCQAVA